MWRVRVIHAAIRGAPGQEPFAKEKFGLDTTAKEVERLKAKHMSDGLTDSHTPFADYRKPAPQL